MRPLALAVAALAGSAAAPPQNGAFVTHFAGKPALPLAASDRAGHGIDLAALRGKVTIVNLWATWCVPCRAELPSLERLAARRPDLVVLAVSNDMAGWPAVDRVWGHQFPHLRLALATKPDMAERLGALALPYSLIIDRRGREVARVPRATAWDSPAAIALLDEAIGRK